MVEIIEHIPKLEGTDAKVFLEILERDITKEEIRAVREWSSSISIKDVELGKRSGKLLYVAGAYSGDTIENIKKAEEVSINLIRNGFHVVTPHKNTSGYEKYEEENITYRTWIDMDLDILSRCNAIYVMRNSQNSNGTQQEIEHAKKLNMPIIYEKDYPSNNFKLSEYYRMISLS